MPMAPGDQTGRALRTTGWLTGIYFFVELGIGIGRGLWPSCPMPSTPFPR